MLSWVNGLCYTRVPEGAHGGRWRVQLSETASWLLVIGFLVSSLITAGALAGIAFGLSKINAKLEALTPKVEPLLQKVDNVLTITNDKVAVIGDKAEDILTQGEEVAESVHQKVDRTATAVQRTVHAPIIGLNSIAAGVSRGMETFGKLQRERPEAAPRTQAQQQQSNSQNGRGAAEIIAVPAGKETLDAG